MQFTASQISQLLGGTLVGDPQTVVTRFAKIEEATATDLSFIANPKYAHYLYTTQAGILLVNNSLPIEQAVSATLIKVPDAYSAIAQLLELYEAQQQTKNHTESPHFIHPSATIGTGVYVGAFAYIAEGASIGNNVQLYPNTYIGKNVVVGNNTIIHPNVSIYANCQIGDNCILHSGVVVGSDGFGFAPQEDGSYKKIPQTGNVTIGNNVEIGANTCIDRATMGSTTIGNGVKLDNLIQIAHNVSIDEHTVIAAQTGISGSTKMGKYCLIGGQAGFAGHITIADGTKINAQSGIAKTIKTPNEAWSGTPAFKYTDNMRANVLFKQLPEMEQRLRELEKIIAKLI